MTRTLPVFWMNWMWLATALLCLFGLSMMLLPGLIEWAFSWMLYADGGQLGRMSSEPVAEYIRLMHGVLGAVMFGWGVMIALVLRGPLRAGVPGSADWILMPLLAWYGPDTVWSLYTGFWPNALLNTGFLILFLVPLLALRAHLPRR